MHNIAAGIILYNPDIIRLKENIEAIQDQVELVILIDNNSINIDSVEKECRIFNNTFIIRNDRNHGIAKALNDAMKFCKAKGFQWVLTLDQDSVCPSNIIEEYKKYINLHNIAIISPFIVDRNIKNKTLKNKKVSKYNFVENCISSGSLTSINIWNAIGGFDNYMFIDLVDFEFCTRLLLGGYKIIRVNDVILLHEVGHITQHKFLFWTINVKNHSSNRKYYMAHNILYCAKKHKKFGSIFVAHLRIIKLLILTIIFEKDKYNKALNIIKGIIDGGNIPKEKYGKENLRGDL